MGGRVKIKHPNRTLDDLLNLLSVLSDHQILATKVNTVRDGFVVLTSNEDDVDTIFNPPCHDALHEASFTPILPPDLKAKRTILLFNVATFIKEKPTEAIQEEVERLNEFTTNTITQIYKFNKYPIIKITFNQTAVAQKAITNGLKMFNMRIPAHDIQQEDYTPLTNCLRCYAIEQHSTFDCPKGRDYRVCSECTSPNHLWHACTSQEKKCLNCEGAHRTLASQCPKRKEAVATKKQAKKEQRAAAPTSYSNATKPTTPAPPSFPPLPALDPEAPAKILTCFIHAHLTNIANPGSFQETLSQTLVANDLPAIKIPNIPDSTQLIKLPGITPPPAPSPVEVVPPPTPLEQTIIEIPAETCNRQAQENNSIQVTDEACTTTTTQNNSAPAESSPATSSTKPPKNQASPQSKKPNAVHSEIPGPSSTSANTTHSSPMNPPVTRSKEKKDEKHKKSTSTGRQT